MFAKRVNILVLFLIALFGLTLNATAAPQALTLQGGDTAEIKCDGRRLVLERVDKTIVMANCRPANTSPTDTPEPEPSDPPDSEPTALSFDFEDYTIGADPDGWLDTAADNSMSEDDGLFQVDAFNGQKVFGTSSIQTNIHSHLMNGEIVGLSGYEYGGRMLVTAGDGGIGVTFFSQYPERDAYYRLRRYHNLTFHLDPHGTSMTGGQTETSVVPAPNDWYYFKVQVQDTGSRTEVRVKIWPEFESEPNDWQINAYDDSSSRLTGGTIGVWSYTSGSKYWDDLTVGPLSSEPGPGPEPTDTPEPEPTDPVSSVEPCPDHDPKQWHPLFDAELGCHYDHEHKEDPKEVDDIFGSVGALYGGQEISYPWQTFSEAGTENELKHGGYGWLVRRDLGCSSAFTDGCLTDFRLQYHGIMAAPGAVTRNHSFWLEARGCQEENPGACGIIRTGGWIDYGHLEIDGQHVPLPGDPSQLRTDRRRVHYYATGNSNFGTWYGTNRIALAAIQTNRMWGLINPENPSELHLFCPDYNCSSNNSMMQAHAIGFNISSELDSDGDGLVTFDGYTNRYGEIVENCSELGLDCVPLQIIDMPVGRYQYRDDTHGLDDGRTDHDTSPADEWWIAYPN
jgi:hypothetical protein